MPDWDGWTAAREIFGLVRRGHRVEPDTDGSQLEEEHNELEEIDVDILGRRGGDIADSMNSPRAPPQVKPNAIYKSQASAQKLRSRQ